MPDSAMKIIFGLLLVVLAIIQYFKKSKSSAKRLEPAISDPEDIINPLTWIFAWVFKYIPDWFYTLTFLLTGLYFVVVGIFES